MEHSESQAHLRFFTTSEIADMLKMNPQVIARKLQKGELGGYKIGKDWRVSEKNLLAWLEKHSNRARLSDSQVVIDRFLKGGRIVSLPVQRKKRRYLLEYILRQFESNRVYTEKEVNGVINRYYEDFCTVRREFICEKMMSRIAGKYRRNSSYKFISSQAAQE